MADLKKIKINKLGSKEDWSIGRLMRTWSWIILILLTILIQVISRYPDLIEKYYTFGFYRVLSRALRFLFGWLPFSVGDLIYLVLIVVLISKIFHVIMSLFKSHWRRKYFFRFVGKLVFFLLLVYVIFYVSWGLNYSRKGIAYQLELKVEKYSLGELDTLTTILQRKLNGLADSVDLTERKLLKKKRYLFRNSLYAFDAVAKQYPFLEYNGKSLKPSLFSYAGNVLGFLGYYNFFSGEGQVNTTVPLVTQPYTACHEMAHQLGYAKENEANFVGYLACKSSSSNAFRYSVYFDLYRYAVGEIRSRDTTLAKAFHEKLHPQVIKDWDELRKFYRKQENRIEPIFNWFYHNFLKVNRQPAGRATYNEVVAWLIAYMHKYGEDAI